MVDLNELQKQVYQNKLNKKFNVTDISMEFALTYRTYKNIDGVITKM